ncbi:MAG: protein-disulfide reductase DsbD [Proteobacteria bacterium]|nr:protein-disulfide reductase DsbD [Pseudomonadota bacterium]
MTVMLSALLAAAFAAPAARAISEADLLPVDQAFTPSAHALGPDRVQIDWGIAKGYYLYRERIHASADAAFGATALQLPEGIHKHDPFFGDVQIYHDHVVALLTGAPSAAPHPNPPPQAGEGVSAGARTVAVTIQYQGCADAGVCYPPQKRVLQVAIPAAAAAGAGSSQVASTGASTVSSLGTSTDSSLGTSTDSSHGASTRTSLGASTGSAPPPSLAALATHEASAASDGLPLPPEQAFGVEAIVDTPDRLLLRFSPAKGYYLYRDKTSFSTRGESSDVRAGSPQWPAAKTIHDAHFGDVAVYFDPVDVPLPLQRQSTAAQKLTLTVNLQGCQTDGICYPPMQRSVTVDLPAGGSSAAIQQGQPGAIAAVPQSGSSSDAVREQPSSPSLWLALLLALGGGLILNLMPCVLPVLSLKALSLAASGESRQRARRHALWYTAGVLASFAVLGGIVIGLRQTGSALGWGFQLQQPLVVAGLAYLMLAVGLALSGVYQFGAGWAGVGQKLTTQAGPAGDFFTGALAVVVASPCTAPLMGGALAYTFAAPVGLALAVFLALGLGLALPFLLIGFVPALASRLPKPGAWMEIFKQVLAFPMYLTAAWLVSVLASQRGAAGVLYVLAGAVALALGLWLWERGRYARRSRTLRAVAAVIVLLALAPLAALPGLPAPTAASATAGSVGYSADKLAELRRNGKVVFVDITADWCITCKANERAVLARPAFRDALARADAVYMVGDYTNVDAPITAFLAEHRAVGIPLYVVYPRSGGPGEVLPNILTQTVVDQALARAAQ